MARNLKKSGRNKSICKNTVRRRQYSPFDRWLGVAVLRLFGWHVEGKVPNVGKYVVTAAPHTTNWDLIIMLFCTRGLGLAGVFLMKETVFWWPLGVLWRWLGGIPINRGAAGSVVPQVVKYFDENESLRLVITPEGTRKAVEHWKLGFYWIALCAGVPIVLGFVDYKTKTTGVGPAVYPSGDLEADFAKIRDFYEQRVGIVPSYKLREGEAERILRKYAARPITPPDESTASQQ